MQATGSAAGREMVFTREFAAPRELVYRAWTDPVGISRWWGPSGFTTTTEVMEVRPGGVWKHVMHGPDGMDYPNKSRYLEVVPNERLVYEHTGGRPGEPGARFTSTVLFEDAGPGRMRLTMRMVFDTPEELRHVIERYGAEEGARQMLDRLAEHLPTVR